MSPSAMIQPGASCACRTPHISEALMPVSASAHSTNAQPMAARRRATSLSTDLTTASTGSTASNLRAAASTTQSSEPGKAASNLLSAPLGSKREPAPAASNKPCNAAEEEEMVEVMNADYPPKKHLRAVSRCLSWSHVRCQPAVRTAPSVAAENDCIRPPAKAC